LPSIDVYSAYPSGGWRQRRGWAIENTRKVSLTTVIEEQTKAMQKVIEDHMDWLKSTGNA
jgi:hypothetical protein